MTGRVAHAGVVMILAMALGGCMAAFEIGAVRRPAQLAALRVGVSTEAEVLITLGEPRRRGAARLVGVDRARAILLYDAYRGDSANVAATFLVVFIDDGRYDGYLWISTATPVGPGG